MKHIKLWESQQELKFRIINDATEIFQLEKQYPSVNMSSQDYREIKEVYELMPSHKISFIPNQFGPDHVKLFFNGSTLLSITKRQDDYYIVNFGRYIYWCDEMEGLIQSLGGLTSIFRRKHTDEHRNETVSINYNILFENSDSSESVRYREISKQEFDDYFNSRQYVSLNKEEIKTIVLNYYNTNQRIYNLDYYFLSEDGWKVNPRKFDDDSSWKDYKGKATCLALKMNVGRNETFNRVSIFKFDDDWYIVRYEISHLSDYDNYSHKFFLCDEFESVLEVFKRYDKELVG